MMLKKQNNIIKATNAATNIDNRNDKDPTPQLYNDDRIALPFLLECSIIDSMRLCYYFVYRLFSLIYLLA